MWTREHHELHWHQSHLPTCRTQEPWKTQTQSSSKFPCLGRTTLIFSFIAHNASWITASVRDRMQQAIWKQTVCIHFHTEVLDSPALKNKAIVWHTCAFTATNVAWCSRVAANPLHSVVHYREGWCHWLAAATMWGEQVVLGESHLLYTTCSPCCFTAAMWKAAAILWNSRGHKLHRDRLYCCWQWAECLSLYLLYWSWEGGGG